MMDTRKRRVFVTLATLCVLAVLSAFVWPTRYKYDHWQIGNTNLLVRIDRFTGRAEFLRADGWQRVVSHNYYSLSALEIAKLDGTLTRENGWLKATVYNGTDVYVTEITVRVEVGAGVERDYSLGTADSGAPRKESKYLARAELDSVKLPSGWVIVSPHLKIVSAHGHNFDNRQDQERPH